MVLGSRILRKKDFKENHHTGDGLKASVSQAFMDIDVNWNLCVTVCHSFGSRIQDVPKLKLLNDFS